MLFRPLFRIRRTGVPRELPEGGVLVCANHQSYLDPAMLQLPIRRRMTFVMTNDFYEVPFARSFFQLLGAIPVPRTRGVKESVRRATALLRLGRAVAVFPEGRISAPDRLGPAQRGLSVLARRADVPVVPVAVAGSARAWPRGGRWLRRADVRVAVGVPQRYEGPPSRENDQAFAERIRAEIDRLWDPLRGHGRVA